MIPASSSQFSDRKTERSLFELHSALDLESFWKANLRLLQSVMPHHSCSLMLGIVDYLPTEARHHVVKDRRPDYQPASNLNIAQPFLAAHPQIKLYTYTDIVRADPKAPLRRLDPDSDRGSWSQLVHLAFWNGKQPEAVLSVRRSMEQGDFTAEELAFLAQLHPTIDGALHRLRALERERARSAAMEKFLSGLPLAVLFLTAEGGLSFATQEGYDFCAVWNFGFKDARTRNSRQCFYVPKEISAACSRLAAGRDVASHSLASSCLSGRVEHPTISGLVARVEYSQSIKGRWVRPGFLVTFASEQNLDGANAELTSEALRHLHVLNASERRVALLVAEGCRNQDVARRLGKSVRTVECQLHTIYRKLEINGRTQLTRLLA